MNPYEFEALHFKTGKPMAIATGTEARILLIQTLL